ncbi:MAG: rhomboid family intramembrane serine protease [Actinobacteria bacterium]|nr:rhomboid family intramembrane serine protease [Actinomycetota bacterium]
MFPLYDSIKIKGIPFLTIILIAITSYIFFKEVTSSNQDVVIQNYSLIPNKIKLNSIYTLTPFFTSMFLHGSLLHIASNMWFLWIFGNDVELFLGRIRFLVIYILSGLAGNIVQYLLMPSSPIPMLGASGAIAGILGAYYFLFPRSKVRTLLFIFFFVTLVNIPASIMLAYWFFLQVLSGLITYPSSQNMGGIAFFAHIGGFLTRAFLTLFMPKHSELLERE